jgi:hypothetical protein
LTADNGAIVYSTASALALLAHTTTAGLPLLSGNAAAPSWGTRSGNTTTYVTTTGSQTSGNITSIDASGNHIASGTALSSIVTSGGSLTANLPVIGAGGQAVAVGTRSGNTTQFVTTTGTQTSGNVVSIDASGNHIAGGTALSSYVVGPASACDNCIVRFDGTTGKLIQNSLPTISDTGILNVKVGSDSDSTGQPSGTFATIIYNATNSTGMNGLFVKNNWTGGDGIVLEVGNDLLGGAYTSLLQAGLNVSVAPTGNTFSTVSSITSQRQTIQANLREITANYGVIADLGNGCVGDIACGDKIALYAGANAKNGSLNVFAANFLTRIESGNTTAQGLWTVEVDQDNLAAHYGDSFPSLTLPLAYGVDITGGSSFRSTAALHVGSLNTGTLPNGQWNMGIFFGNPSAVHCAVCDFSLAITSYYDTGTHTVSFDLGAATNSVGWARIKNNDPLTYRNFLNNADISVLKLDASNLVNLYNGGLTLSSAGVVTSGKYIGTTTGFATSATAGVNLLAGGLSVKTGSEADSTGQPGTNWAAIVYDAVNNSGAGGLFVKNNFATTDSITFEVGTDVVSGAYASSLRIFGDGTIVTPRLPTSAGGGGIFVCVDTSGNLYKKATCP